MVPASSETSVSHKADVLRAMGGMLALAAAMGIGRFVYTPILPPMADALALTKSQAGLIAAANFAGYLLGALLLALPRLPGTRRAWFFASLILGSATLAGMALSDDMAGFLTLRFVSGICSACVLVLGSSLVIERLAAPRLASWHFAGVGLGIAISAVLVDALQAAGSSWRMLWLASAAAAVAVVPFCARMIPERQAAPTARTLSARPPAEGAPGLVRLSTCHGLFGFGYVITATFLVTAVRAAPNARILEPTVWLIVGLAAIPSTAIWGKAGRAWGAARAYGVACALEAAGVAAGGVWPNAAGALLASILLGGTFMGITALGFTAARHTDPVRQARSFAVMTAAFGLGQIAGPVVGGWLIDRTHSFAAPSLLAAAALSLAALIAAKAAPRGVAEAAVYQPTSVRADV